MSIVICKIFVNKTIENIGIMAFYMSFELTNHVHIKLILLY